MDKFWKGLRIFFGIFMVFFGVNRFIPLLPEPIWPPHAQMFLDALNQTNYMNELIAGCDILTGILLLINRFVPLALIAMFPVLANAILFHIFLAPQTMLFALIGVVLNFLFLYHYREFYRTLFRSR